MQRTLLTLLAVILSSKYIPELNACSFGILALFSLVLSLLNALIRPILMILTIPINLLTLGLFSFVINAFIFWLGAKCSYGIEIASYTGILFGGGILTIVNILTSLLKKKKLSFA